MRYGDNPFENAEEIYPILLAYRNKVAAAGSWATAIFVPKFPLLPEDAISHIVGLWAHTGWY